MMKKNQYINIIILIILTCLIKNKLLQILLILMYGMINFEFFNG